MRGRVYYTGETSLESNIVFVFTVRFHFLIDNNKTDIFLDY